MGFRSVKLWKFSKILNIDSMLYYICIHCLLTLCAIMRLKYFKRYFLVLLDMNFSDIGIPYDLGSDSKKKSYSRFFFNILEK